MTTTKMARMRRMSTTIELNDIGRISSATTVRLNPNPQRPSSVPLDSYNASLDPFIMQGNQKYLQVFSPTDDQHNSEILARVGSMCSIQENSTFQNNNNCNTSVANISGSFNPSATSSIHENSFKLLITKKIRLPETVKKIISGIILVLIVSASSTGAIQLAKISLMDNNFYAPYFLAYFWINWTIISYPLYIIATIIGRYLRLNSRKSSKDLFREAKTMYNPASGGTSRINSVIAKCLLFMVLWIIINYMYCLSLGYLSPSETSALFVSHPAFIYLISWIYFHDAFVSARFQIIAVLLSIVGVVLMAHATGIGTTNFIGIVAAVVSSSIAAIFKILFKSFFGEPNFNHISLFFTILGMANLIFNLPLTFILYITSAEKIVWLSAPWNFICLSGALALVWQTLTNLGKTSDKSIYISVGLFISLPLNAVVDFGLRSTVMGTFQIIGSVCILTSCILLLLPSDFMNRFPGSLLMKADV